MTRVISRRLVPAGGDGTSSTTTPIRDFLRNGTSTRQPGCKTCRSASGTAYVKVVRSGTGSATLQNGADIAVVSVPARQTSPADDRNPHENRDDADPLLQRDAFAKKNGSKQNCNGSVER